MLSNPEQELNWRLQEAEASKRSATARAEETEMWVTNIEERLLLARIEVARSLDAKDGAIEWFEQ